MSAAVRTKETATDRAGSSRYKVKGKHARVRAAHSSISGMSLQTSLFLIVETKDPGSRGYLQEGNWEDERHRGRLPFSIPANLLCLQLSFITRIPYMEKNSIYGSFLITENHNKKNLPKENFV